jgi:hypothetical protein
MIESNSSKSPLAIMASHLARVARAVAPSDVVISVGMAVHPSAEDKIESLLSRP